MIRSICCSCIFCFIFGCTSYLTGYDTYLLNSDPPKSRQFKDDKFEFNFLPVVNGVWYQIKNLTEKPAFLSWDRCYFIAPDGNSSKALNTDIIHENTETKEKAKYESVLPPNAIFYRFTTSALNSELFTAVDFNEFRFANAEVINITTKKFPSFGNYWPEYKEKYAPNDSLKKYDLGLKEIEGYILNNNKMGLGISIKLNDTILDYRFDFKFKSVEIWKMSMYDTTICNASEEGEWKWKKKAIKSKRPY